ncbi:MAG: hypothetical protein ACR2MG_16850 [Pyrinomonadaceae bacterium]
MLNILRTAKVQYGFPKGEKPTKVNFVSYFDTKESYPSESIIIPLEQPYGTFAKAVLENQVYPNLKDEKGNPIPPYDVTAHTLSLLLNIKAEEIKAPFKPSWVKNAKIQTSISDCMLGWQSKIGIYKSHIPVMDEGWTRWVFQDAPCMEYENIIDQEIEANNFNQKKPPHDNLSEKLKTEKGLNNLKYKTIIFPDQSLNQILNGFAKGAMPDEYTGGIGADGVANLKKFAEAGGTLVFFNRASNFAIEQFDLPVKDVTKGLARKDLFIPGSILRTELDTTNPIAKGMPKDSIAWFENSPAFEVAADAKVEIIAKYPSDAKNILLSGYALGAERIAGKAALISIPMGKGKIILFGFRPQYRGQSLATFPLLFNAIQN